MTKPMATMRLIFIVFCALYPLVLLFSAYRLSH